MSGTTPRRSGPGGGAALTAMSLSGRDISSKEKRSRQHLAIVTSDPRNAKDKSRQKKRLCDITETIEVTIKNRGCDINNKKGQLT